jgi:hypothetical protein
MPNIDIPPKKKQNFRPTARVFKGKQNASKSRQRTLHISWQMVCKAIVHLVGLGQHLWLFDQTLVSHE